MYLGNNYAGYIGMRAQINLEPEMGPLEHLHPISSGYMRFQFSFAEGFCRFWDQDSSRFLWFLAFLGWFLAS